MRSRAILIVFAAAVVIAFFYARHQNPRAPKLPIYRQIGPTALSSITPAEALAIAESYVNHEWIPAEMNTFHGVDPEGIRVDTPDANFQPAGDDGGWWIVGERNVGLPYKWGGFDLPEEFDRGLREGKYAGDAYSAEKRRLLDAAVSVHAVGIDCSGFISRCWRLPRSYSTRELPELCEPVSDFAKLQPGDIFNKHNAHVRLFASWANAERTVVRIYEASGRVLCRDLPLQPMIEEGYSVWRYRGLRD
jgi:cell wall-associated NlpC family hydrolase